MTRFTLSIVGFAARAKSLLARWIERAAERRMRAIQFEMRMYEGVYRHSSKNDDDLPMAR